MEVIICETYDEMSKSAAEAVADVLNAKPNAVLGMATGSTPSLMRQRTLTGPTAAGARQSTFGPVFRISIPSETDHS